MEELYENYKKMINKIANQFYKKYNKLEFEDIQAQANLIFCEAFYKWNKDKSSFSTFLWNQLNWKLSLYIKRKRETQKIEHTTNEFYISYCDKQYEATNLLTSFKGVSKECMKVLKLIISPTKKEIKETIKTKKPISKNNIKKYLHSQGIKYNTIEHAFYEIEKVLYT